MTSLDDVLAVTTFLAGFSRPWFVAGGWAIDLFIGTITRPHEDLEVVAMRRDQDALRAYLSGWTLRKVVNETWVPWETGEWLDPPVFQVQAQHPDTAYPVFEAFLNETCGDTWIFRHRPAVTRPVAALGLPSSLGIPIIAPELQLLYKAKRHRPKDDLDFDRVCDHLSPAQRAWLRDALQTYYPQDPWLFRLQSL